MASYDERLTQRQEAAADTERGYVQHFGPEAERYDNWARLWQTGWQEELNNPAPTPTYQPKGLPRDEANNIITGGSGEYGKVLPPAPSLYSPKFLFTLAQTVANGGPHLVAAISSILDEADEVDCDQLTEVLDTLLTYLSNYALRSIDGTGHAVRISRVDRAQVEDFFLHWDENKEASNVFVTRLGIAVPSRPVVPYEVALNVLHAAQRQVQARRIEYARATQALAALTTKRTGKKKLSLAAVALILVYESKYLQRGSEADELAQQAGHNSGEKLYQEYCKYSAMHNRTGFDDQTVVKGRNMIKRIQEALPELSTKARERAENEVRTIEAIIL
jgi:hypothetical protein